MATLSHSESRRLYSWWWDSHISPKNSKWLQEDLADMDYKVKAMIKLIEEDADSFARRAEMYYKKRPELMKLVEEFYRAYRALAERYDHATVELRQAHRTMAEAFPDKVSYSSGNGSNSGLPGPNGEPHTPEPPHPVQSLLDSCDLHTGELGVSSAGLEGLRNRGLKELADMFRSGGVAVQSSRRVADGEMEVEFLKRVLAEIKAEKEAVVLQYQNSLQKLSKLEKELQDAGGLDERASRAEIEIRVLKEALAKLETERDASHLQLNEYLEKISSMENMNSKSLGETNCLHERASKEDVKAQSLIKEFSGLEAEKEASLLQYNQCLEMIFILRNRISSAEENARWLDEQTEKAEAEIKTLKQALSELNEEKDNVELRYQRCLGRIAELESEISLAHEDVERLNAEVMKGVAKLKNAEEQCDILERSNQSLQLAAQDLVQKISIKDQELLQKENELQRLQTLLKDEQSRFGQVEATLQALQRLHSESRDKQTALANELENKLQMLKDLEGDLEQAKEESWCLTELNDSSSIAIVNLQNEICSLKELKEKLEEDLALQVAQSNSLQEEIHCLKEELESLNERYQALLEQLRSVGINPDAIAGLVKNMQEENSKLKEVCNKGTDEKELLYAKLKELDNVLEMNVALEKSLSELNSKLEGSEEKIEELKGSCQLLQGEKSGLVSEKAILLSQLQMMTENMQKLFEKNALAENSLSLANIELEGLKAKSKSLEEFCQMLKDEKFSILNERNNLVAQLQNVELRLGNLEVRFSLLEEKCNDLGNEKNSTFCQVKELQVFLGIEKQERAKHVQSSEFRMGDLEKQVHVLQEETRLSKKEFEEELDKAVNSQVEIFVLQKFIKDLEQKNLSLLLECQKHVEASKLSNKLMAEFETENLEQQVEIEFLLDEIEQLRRGVHQVFKALQLDPVYGLQDKFEEEQFSFEHILENCEGLKFSLLKSEDEKQQSAVENQVLLTLLEQLSIEGTELDSIKKSLEKEFQIMTKQLMLLQKDNCELLEMNRQLKLEVAKQKEREEVLKGQLESQHLNVVDLQHSHQALQEEHFKVLEENSSFLQKILDLKKKGGELEEDYDSVLQEAVTLSNLLLVFKHFSSEKGEELKLLYEDLGRLHSVSSDLRKKVEMLEQKLDTEEAESLKLNETIEKLHQKLHERENLNEELNYQILIGKEFLREQATELLEAQKKLEVTRTLNSKFCSTIEEMNRECEASNASKKSMEMQIHELSEDRLNQQMEIECLRKTNEDLQSEVCELLWEVEESRLKEENLVIELQEKSNELWENEASSFYFDLQTCAIRELLIENKVHELTSACDHLEEINANKDAEIEEMKENFGILESEIGGLKAQLLAYVPVIASLQGNVESLELNVLQTKSLTMGNQRNLDVDVAFQTPKPNYGELTEDKSSLTKDGLSDLLEMQVKIKAVEKAITQRENWLAADNTTHVATGADAFRMQEKVKSDVKLEPPLEEAEIRELQGRLNGVKGLQNEIDVGNEPLQNSSQQVKKPAISEGRNAIFTKDIPLDEISDLLSHRRSRRESTETESADDKMFDLWGSGEFEYNADPIAKGMRKQGAVLLKTRSRRRVHRAAKQKRVEPSVELLVEKEVGIDKLEVPRNSTEEFKQEGSRGKILERLESDAKKLISIQIAVEELKRKMEMKKKSKRDKKLEVERVKRQLLEVDDMILQLFGMTNQLARDSQQTIYPEGKNASIDLEEAGRKRVMEQACKGSEKIGRLQFEVESIRYSLLKLEDEKKSKSAQKFPGSKTVLLRDFIYSGSRRKSRKGKKTCFCGCGRPLTHED